MKPLISIIIPTYNRESLTIRAINSIDEIIPYEIVIIDDGSKKFNKIKKKYCKIISLKKNSGPSFCRNLGVKYSSGDYIAFLDSDDIFFKNKLYKQLNYLTKNDSDICLCGYTEKNLGVTTSYVWDKYFDILLNLKNGKNFPNTSSMLIKKNKFELLGGFNINLRQSEDLDFLIRAQIANLKICSLNQKLYCFDGSADNRTSLINFKSRYHQNLNFINSINNLNLKHLDKKMIIGFTIYSMLRSSKTFIYFERYLPDLFIYFSYRFIHKFLISK